MKYLLEIDPNEQCRTLGNPQLRYLRFLKYLLMKNAFHMYIALHIVPAQLLSFQLFESVSIVRTNCHPADKA